MKEAPTPADLEALELVLRQYHGVRDGGPTIAEGRELPGSGNTGWMLPATIEDIRDPVDEVLRQTRGSREANDCSVDSGGGGTHEELEAK